ncbi:LuxR C-terminal-related transcriptional regulator [Flammeovirgaceae bacterium SG7u.111]|nr:LuxR C-terminal-related transcriptional regulator [Flammeovirgaceae bacterium SG7u.132]WPO38008.1 LuxR C-terminal-related transcriptional regulator [Flammeovirgaceae bacterium SG7u.111]
MESNYSTNVRKMNTIWKTFRTSFGETSKPLDMPQLEKYIGDLFSVGDFYYYVIDFSQIPHPHISFVDPNALEFHGLTREEFSLNHVLAAVHEEDVPFCTACEKMILEIFTGLERNEMLYYKSSYTLRIRDASGKYKFIQHQAVPISLDTNGGISYALNVHTDVGHITQQSGGIMSLIGLEGRKSYIGIDPFNPQLVTKNPLSIREREVLEYLSRGHTSKEISEMLHISKHTVDSHRRKMLEKLEVVNTVELIQKAKTLLLF